MNVVYSVRWLPWRGNWVSKDFRTLKGAQNLITKLQAQRKAYCGQVYHFDTNTDLCVNQTDDFKEYGCGEFRSDPDLWYKRPGSTFGYRPHFTA